ncbi:methionine--tRNA ligase [Candidatus Pacearchaeota archaeon]|nr:methionine--tRNA ligase [Candidatus Pacearchaeota archaeon]
MVKDKFYVTTAIDYVNAAPHIGHAYQKIIADVLARWNKLSGKDVLFVTGTDEHGKKVQESAEKAGVEVKEFVDSIVVKFKEAWKSLNIDYDRFIRTTDEDHKKVVEEFIQKCNDKGEIYKDKYTGLYCTGCEQFYTEKEVENNICPMHNRPLEKIEEESYFFKLSNYTEELLKLYEKHPEFIQPKTRRNEIINRVKEGLRDLSITRTSFDWGIPFPLDNSHVTYVWFDALINYYTATREKDREDFWGEPTVHLLGKDNTWFHTVYWPAMLKSAGLDLPRATVNHGFLTFNGQKISKSLGNAISPQVLVEKYGPDSIRYFVCRHFPFATGEDGDFDEAALVERHNGELSNKLGNLISRVSGLIEKNGMEKSERTLDVDFDKINSLMENFEVDKALNEIFAFIDRCNEHVQNEKPWETKDKKVLYELAEAIKKISILLYSFIPDTCKKISEKFGGYEFSFEEFENPLVEVDVVKGENLFSRIDAPENKVKPNLNKSEEPKEIMENVTTIQFDDFIKVELKVAQIKEVEEIPKADKLYKLTLDDGSADGRTICAGIKEFYSMDELKNKKIIIVANLAPRKLRGIESRGMLLAASNKDHSVVSLISPDKDIEAGSLVG